MKTGAKLLFIITTAVLFASSSAVNAATFTVTSTADAPDAVNNGICADSSGACTLRAALHEANLTSDADTIIFAIRDAGVRTISLTSPLPDITQRVTIDGYSQSGATVNTSADATNAVLLIEINGAGVGNFSYGFRLPKYSSPTGGSADSSGSVIRGLIINRFNQGGIWVDEADDVVIEGNFIGTDASGTVALGNGGIGGTGRSGIFVTGENVRIGGTTRAARNLISGNAGSGVQLSGANGVIAGNLIGTTASGNAALPNGFGVRFSSGLVLKNIENNVVGGTTAAARNIISGNGTGVSLGGEFTDFNQVIGNYIGLNSAGTGAVPNTTGVLLITRKSNGGPPNNRLGGTTAAERNIISGNSGVGVAVSSNGDRVLGNYIGSDPSGTNAIGNGSHGVQVLGPESNESQYRGENNTIGFPDTSGANLIAFNAGDGVRISRNAQNNFISANSIHSNGGLGINLGDDAVTLNDQNDEDAGENQLQNFPILTEVTTGDASTTVTGKLQSTPAKTFLLQFFANAGCDPSGYGEGQTYIGVSSVETNQLGEGSFTATLPFALPAGHSVTATASALAVNTVNIRFTSEFSPCLAVAPPGGILQFSSGSYVVGEAGNAASITVIRTGGSAGQVTVNYSTSNGTATAGNDYTSASGTLIFAPGETSKSFQVPITNDTARESSETINLALSTPGGGAILSGQTTALLTVLDNDGPPAVSINDASLAEGNSGTMPFTFAVTLSHPTNETVVVRYATAPGTATAASDYNPASADIVFAPGQTTQNVTTDVIGDTTEEPDETFFVDLTLLSGTASIAKNRGTGTILDDDTTKPSLLGNIATRLRVETGDNALIGGFIVTGSQPKKVILRAIGPSLDLDGKLQDPQLELYNSAGELIRANDNWEEAENRQEIIDSTIPPSHPLEPAILMTLPAGNSAYTAVVRGVNGTTGIGVVEGYDLDQRASSKLANISTRGLVETGEDVMIGGFFILNGAQKVIIRAIGPSLPVDGRLEDPKLELYNGSGDLIAANENWRDTQEAQIIETTIPPSHDLEAAIVATLPPAPYTAVVKGAQDATGVGLVEVYALN